MNLSKFKLSREGLKGFIRKRSVPMIVLGSVCAIAVLAFSLTNQAVKELKSDQVANRNCMLQLIVGGSYTKNPDCQYPNEPYDSLRDEISTQTRIDACILQLHVSDNMPVPVERIQQCQSQAVNTVNTNFLLDDQAILNQNNSNTPAVRSSGKNGGDGKDGKDAQNSPPGFLESVLDRVGLGGII